MIYTLTFNPAIDYIVRLDKLKTGETNRSVLEEMQFGGKGINVSYVLAQLGVESVAVGFAAGFTGDELVKMVKSNGINADFIRLNKGNTRINVKIKEQTETEINASGPKITRTAIKQLFQKLDLLESGDTLVLSGSVPPSLPSSIYEEIILRLQDKRIRFIVDAAGELLKNVLKYRPFLIKPNLPELEELSERKLVDDKDVVGAARQLQELGARNVLVSLGADGAILLDENGTVYRQSAPKIEPLNTVGAGDSMVAGFLSAVGCGYEQALRMGVAAGSATAASQGLASKEEILEYLK